MLLTRRRWRRGIPGWVGGAILLAVVHRDGEERGGWEGREVGTMENDYTVRTESDKRRSSCFDQSEDVSVALGARIRVIPGTREREGESTERVIAARALSPSSSLC